jgi:hypothetical protein
MSCIASFISLIIAADVQSQMISLRLHTNFHRRSLWRTARLDRRGQIRSLEAGRREPRTHSYRHRGALRRFFGGAQHDLDGPNLCNRGISGLYWLQSSRRLELRESTRCRASIWKNQEGVSSSPAFPHVIALRWVLRLLLCTTRKFLRAPPPATIWRQHPEWSALLLERAPVRASTCECARSAHDLEHRAAQTSWQYRAKQFRNQRRCQ